MFSRILMPIDIAESDMSQKAINTINSLVDKKAFSVRLLSCQTILPAAYDTYLPEKFYVNYSEDAKKVLTDISKKINLPKDNVSIKVRMGGVYNEVLKEAEEWKADLIAIGSHRPSMASFFLGSNAKAIVGHSKCTVLVVR